MTKSLADRLASLARVAKDLDTVSDRVTKSLRAVEERLRLLGLGVEVELTCPALAMEDHGEHEINEARHFMLLSEITGEPIGTAEQDLLVRSMTETLLAYTMLADGTQRIVARSYDCTWIRHRNDAPVGVSAHLSPANSYWSARCSIPLATFG